MTITFVCGHGAVEVADDTTAPECPQCHETRIARVTAPAPRFTGAVTGPLVAKK